MKAVVMAGGEGARLRPLTIKSPKPMMPLIGKPVMEHILALLQRHSITEVIVTIQYLGQNIQEYFGDGSQLGMHITYSVEETPLGTAGSVKNAESLLQEPFIVISGDALTDYDLSTAIAFHTHKKSLATLILAHVANPLEFGVVITNSEGHITQFLEKPSWGEVFSDTINTGIYVLDPKIFSYFEKNKAFDFSQDLFPIMLKQGDPMYGFIANGYWCDVGNLSEYLRANADILLGKVAMPISTRQIRNGIWCEENVTIHPSAVIYGSVYIGHGTEIKSDAHIYGPTVIGAESIIDEHAEIERSVLQDHVYIGMHTKVRGSIIGRSSCMKERVLTYEGTVIGDNCLVQEGAVLQSNVKIWPGKTIETGATITNSIVWGALGRKTIFSRDGVSGLINIDLTPEFAAKLGAAFGANLPKGSHVSINRDTHRSARMIKRAMIAGLPSTGINAQDIRQVPLPVARFFTRTSDAMGGIYVRVSPMDERTVDVKFFDQNGMDINKSTERKIENLFFREDFRRVFLDDIGTINVHAEQSVIKRYMDGFAEVVNKDIIRERAFRVVIDYAHGSCAAVLPSILHMLGCEIVSLHSNIIDTRPVTTDSILQADMQNLATITANLQYDIGVRIDPSGERIALVDNKGNILDGLSMLAIMSELLFRQMRTGTIVVPVTASSVIKDIANRYNGFVQHTKAQAYAITNASIKEGVIMAADEAGGFVFPSLQPAFDGMLALAKLLELLATFHVQLSDIMETLPRWFISRTQVACAWEHKGLVMRVLSERYEKQRAEPIDGVRIEMGNEWVLVLPDADRPLVHVVAESTSSESAISLTTRFANIVGDMQC
jgi:mannose-1-phosphate guanylyltransferase/phosphomannomutase